jgi:hypothetical protein
MLGALEALMTRITLTLAVLLIPTMALGQDAGVMSLGPDRLPTVTVLDDRGVETKGKLVTLDADAVVLRIAAEQVRFDLAQVRRITRLGDPLTNGALVGAAIGAGLGVLKAYLAADGAGEKVAVVAASTAVCAAIGACIDGIVEGRKVIYQTPTLRVSAGTTGGAVGITIRW